MPCFVAKHGVALFILSNILFIPSVASGNTYIDSLKTQAIEKKLHEHNAWIALLHYRKKLFSKGYHSQADNRSFFFSLQGANDPQSELMATIEAMSLPESLGDEHPQCTFPARFAWLKKQLSIDLTQLPTPGCDCLKNWTKQLNINQVTIVFPTAYLNNPSSMFGHLFLRFEPSDRTESNLLMAYTINFAADTSAQEGVADYIYRGLFGGFPSTNSIRRFHERFKRYSDIESRDIWEYTLNLSQEELDQLVLHVWELRGSVFDYYFLDENCAYRLIALLEVARPGLALAEEFTIYTIPGDTIRALRERGAIQSSTYRASAVKTFYHHIKDLNETETEIVINIVQKQLPLDSPRILSLPPKRRAIVLSLASEYLTILINKDMLDRKVSTQLTRRIFAERIDYSMPITFDKIPWPSASPDNGHKTHRISIAGGCNKNDSFYSIGYRDAYHSLLDPLPGFEKGAQVEFLNIKLRGYEGNDIRLEQLDIINITSLTPINSYLKPASWKFSFGRERKELYSKQPLVYYIEGNMGITSYLGDCMLSGMVHLTSDFGGALDHGYGLGAGLYFDLVYQSETYSYDVGVLYMKYLVGDNDSLTKLWGETSFPLSKNDAIFSQIQYTPNSRADLYEINLGVHHYF